MIHFYLQGSGKIAAYDETVYEVASKELAAVKSELTLLQSILEQKDKELNMVKAAKTKFLDLMRTEQDAGVAKITNSLRDELKAKQDQLMEVDMKLRFSESKVWCDHLSTCKAPFLHQYFCVLQVKTFESHAEHLKDRVASLEKRLEETTQEKQDILTSLKKKILMRD